MAQQTSLSINPGKSIGFLALGGSLYNVLTRLKSQPLIYPIIDVLYSYKEPLTAPVILSLPENGLRLRFDGQDQRLRLIEVLEFSKIPLTYKNIDLVKALEVVDEAPSNLSSRPTGPAFRQVYNKLFGPTFSGEYFPPSVKSEQVYGAYVLSYPGIAFSFPVQDSAWSPKSDFVTVLSSAAALPAKSLVVFDGPSWADARGDLYTRPCPYPRSLALGSRSREHAPDEVELIKVCGLGRMEILRRSSPSFMLTLNETTPQDLVAELGPPDAIYRKYDRRLSIHKTRTASRSDAPRPLSSSPGQFDGISDNDHSSVNTATDDSDMDGDAPANSITGISTECFYNYFQHGFDVFISHPSSLSPGLTPLQSAENEQIPNPNGARLVATKMLIHANIPGSYAFNRYRRSRWVLDHDQFPEISTPLASETPFTQLAPVLREVWKSEYESREEEISLQRPMVLNRGWGDSPGSSCELLGGWEESAEMMPKTTEPATALANTELYGFPGLLFEVLKNDAVGCLTIY